MIFNDGMQVAAQRGATDAITRLVELGVCMDDMLSIIQFDETLPVLGTGGSRWLIVFRDSAREMETFPTFAQAFVRWLALVREQSA